MSEWWRLDGWPTADEWQAVWALVTAGIALSAAWIALRHYSSAVRNEIEQGRPFVIGDITWLGTLYACIEITNVGKTGAYDVTFSWSTRPVALDEIAQGAIDRALVDGGIPFLAPGRSIRFMLNKFDEPDPRIPRRFELAANYLGHDGRAWNSDSVLDIDQWTAALADADPFENVTRQLTRLADASTVQKEAHVAMAKAADSVNVYLEAGPRVQMAREKRRAEREARWAKLREQDATRQAQGQSGDGESATA